MRRVRAFGLVLVTGLGGCATFMRGMEDEVAVMSDPPGAAVETTLGIGCAATPCSLHVARDAVFSVTVSKPGYASETVAVTTRVSSAGAAAATENLTTGGLGLVVDAATGATLEHVPNPVRVTLAATGPAMPAHPDPKPIHRRAA